MDQFVFVNKVLRTMTYFRNLQPVEKCQWQPISVRSVQTANGIKVKVPLVPLVNSERTLGLPRNGIRIGKLTAII